MEASDFNITTYVWLHHESLGSPTSHINSLTLFRDSVVRPSLKVLDTEIERLQGSDEPGDEFLASDFEELFQASVEGYLLTIQSMWERGLRSMLVLREKELCEGEAVSKLERSVWQGDGSADLHHHFKRLMGFPITVFDSYADLQLLQSLGSAIRHGEGASAKRVHLLRPELWWNWLPPGETYQAGPFKVTVPMDAPAHPPFSSITLPEELLEQMIQSVVWFWQDIEDMRCNSFKRKHPSVVERLARWVEERAGRASSRIWPPA